MTGDHTAPDPADVRLGVLMLCHENLDIAARMARMWAANGARVAIHLDRKVPAAQQTTFVNALNGTGVTFSARRDCEWGTFSLVAATQDTAELLLNSWPDVTHVLTVSGSCLPLRPVDELRAFLARHPGHDFIESVAAGDVGWAVGGLNEERFTLRFPFSFRRHRRLFDRYVDLQRRVGFTRRIPRGIVPHLGSQWWCLTAKTLSAILRDPSRKKFDRYFRAVWIPDESYFQTLARRHSTELHSRSLTLSLFDNLGKPYVFYDDHKSLLETSRAFVARKIWPGAHALFARFPAPGADGRTDDDPEPERIEALVSRVSLRHRLGRPGLYMQSRFPRKDAENGKTSRPYAVIYGFGDLYPEIGDWLNQETGVVMHGHLLSREFIDFAGGGSVGPGCLSDSPALRDLDPQGFLAALIRSQKAAMGFLFSARDHESLNWFMATDPNARIHVLTGAWLVPLLQSGMPFDDIRRAAARMQRVESRLINVIESVWVKARIHRWTLAEALAKPEAPLRLMVADLSQMTGRSTPIDRFPQPRSVEGVMRLLQQLSNAGLRHRHMGDGRTLRMLATGGENAKRQRPPQLSARRLASPATGDGEQTGANQASGHDHGIDRGTAASPEHAVEPSRTRPSQSGTVTAHHATDPTAVNPGMPLQSTSPAAPPPLSPTAIAVSMRPNGAASPGAELANLPDGDGLAAPAPPAGPPEDMHRRAGHA